MKEKKKIRISIHPVEDHPGDYLAYFRSEFLDATYTVSQLRGDDFINCYTTQLIRHFSNKFEAARKGLCPGGKGNRVRAGG